MENTIARLVTLAVRTIMVVGILALFIIPLCLLARSVGLL